MRRRMVAPITTITTSHHGDTSYRRGMLLLLTPVLSAGRPGLMPGRIYRPSAIAPILMASPWRGSSTPVPSRILASSMRSSIHQEYVTAPISTDNRFNNRAILSRTLGDIPRRHLKSTIRGMNRIAGDRRLISRNQPRMPIMASSLPWLNTILADGHLINPSKVLHQELRLLIQGDTNSSAASTSNGSSLR